MGRKVCYQHVVCAVAVFLVGINVLWLWRGRSRRSTEQYLWVSQRWTPSFKDDLNRQGFNRLFLFHNWRDCHWSM